MLSNKCILVGITGGIAAYKVPELISRMVKAGADVHVIMSESAGHFVTPLTLQTISGNPVSWKTFNTTGEAGVQHIELADKADLFVLVPATANIIGKVRGGIADDLLSTVVMATTAPVLFAPAMNVHMYENPIVQENILYLQEKGYHFIEPDTGRLACGYVGKGRLPEIDVIFKEIVAVLNDTAALNQDLEGRKVVITAGPTREYLDPVRFFTNGSTGKMGYAIAEAVRDRGGQAVLVSGPVHLSVPAGVTHIPVVTAEEMYQAVVKHYEMADVVIKAAAVADYCPVQVHAHKMKKTDGPLELEFERTRDILRYLGEQKKHQLLVGFAAETENLLNNAAKKVEEKNLDLIVANDITVPGAGFGSDTNIVKILHKDGKVEALSQMSKREVAHQILDRVTALLNYNSQGK